MSEYNEFELPDYDFEDEEDEKVQVTRRRRTKKEEPGIIIPKELHEIPEEFLKDNIEVKKIVLHNDVRKIGKNAFSGCEKLKEIEFPNSIIEIEEEAFSRCIKLETVTLPESLTKIGKEAFSGCKSLKTIIIHSQIAQLSEAVFKDCINLKEVILPEKLIKIGKETFRNCCKLPEIILPEHLAEIDEKAFYGCKELKSISIPIGVTEIKDKVFYDCDNLENVKLPDTLENIGVSAFEGCSLRLKTITIPENTQLLKNRAFARCGALEEITLNKTCFTDTDTDLDTFDKCYSLKLYSSNLLKTSAENIPHNEEPKVNCTKEKMSTSKNTMYTFGEGVLKYFKTKAYDDNYILLTIDNDIYEKVLTDNDIDRKEFEELIKKYVRRHGLSSKNIDEKHSQVLAVALIAHQMKLAYDTLLQDSSSIIKKLSNFYYNTDDVQLYLYGDYFFERNLPLPTSQDAIWTKAAEGFKRVNRLIYDYSSLKESQDKYVKYIYANLIDLHRFEFDFLRLLFANEINRKTFATKDDFEKYFTDHKKDVLRGLVDRIYDKINNKLDKYIVDYQKNAIINESILVNQFWRMYENWDGDEPEYRSYNADNSSNNNDFYVELKSDNFIPYSEQAVTPESVLDSAKDFYIKLGLYDEDFYLKDSSLDLAACPTSFAILTKKAFLDKFSKSNRTDYSGINEFSDYIVLKYSKYPENFYEKLPESYKAADFDKPKLLGGIKVGRNEFLNIQGLEPKLDSQKYKNESVENPLTGTETITILANGEKTDSYRLIAPQKKELPATIKTVWEKINAQKSDRQAASEISEKKAYETLNAGKNTTVNPKDYIAIRKKDGSVKYVSIVSKEYKMLDIISTVSSLEQDCPFNEELIKFQEGIRIWLEHVGVAKGSEIRRQCLRLRLVASAELLKELGDYPEYKIFIPLVKLGIAELYYDDITNGYVYGIAKSSAEEKSPLEYLKALPSLKDYITNSTSIFEKIDDTPTKGYVHSYGKQNFELITLSDPCIFKPGKESYCPDYFYMNSKEAFRLKKFIPDSKDICNSYIRAYKIIKEKCKWEKPFAYIPQKKILICNYLKGMPSVYVRALIMQDKEALTRSGGEIRLFACNNHNKQVFYNIDEAFVSELEKKISDI